MSDSGKKILLHLNNDSHGVVVVRMVREKLNLFLQGRGQFLGDPGRKSGLQVCGQQQSSQSSRCDPAISLLGSIGFRYCLHGLISPLAYLMNK